METVASFVLLVGVPNVEASKTALSKALGNDAENKYVGPLETPVGEAQGSSASAASARAILAYPTSEDSYEGAVNKNGKPHGKGVLKYDDGRIYDGEWVNGKEHGTGTLTKPDGSTYKGDWVKGKKHGTGILTTADGSTDKGDWVNGKRQGKGEQTYKDGYLFWYTGCWLEDRWHGWGILRLKDGSTYAGYFDHGLKEGNGMLMYRDGKYDGDFKADKRDGRGKMEYCDGTIYDGSWKDDKRNGYGRLIRREEDGRVCVLHAGLWKDDEPITDRKEQ
ncbi:hypothetical protein AGMMS49949_01970 [Alphaproteobacteria bacterium]|nr:hypothetical protein AGMMS49949_01970 [Alphaproteobacteria bacterium]GHS95769.1 hypothetical protein AGMMS50296_0860 [Alphaproteobacteria bacterium]